MGANPLNMIPCAERTAPRECQDRILARTILHDEPASAALNEPESSAKGCGLIAAPRDLFVHPITLTNEHSPALCPVAPVNLPVLPEEGALARLRRPRNLRRRGFRSRLQLRLGNFHRCALRCCLRLGLRFGLCFSLGRWLLGAIFSCRATRVLPIGGRPSVEGLVHDLELLLRSEIVRLGWHIQVEKRISQCRRLGTCARLQLWLGTCARLQPWLGTCARLQLRLGTCARLQLRLGTCARL